ncbi:hypothetical protein DRQ33_04370 [bacterium]|nr:MAG: hypothetical protein DRQ33_04370 [bacterium]
MRNTYFIGGIIFIILLFFGCKTKVEYDSSKLLDYDIVNRAEQMRNDTTSAIYSVMLKVDKMPQKEHLKNTALKICEDNKRKYQKFLVNYYLPGMNTDGREYSIVEFYDDKLKTITVNNYVLNTNPTTIVK